MSTGTIGTGSLRDSYSTPPTSWSFVPPSNASASTPAPPAVDVEPTYQWSARPRPNSIYELSPDLIFEPSAPNAMALLRAAAASAILQYLSAAVENPLEVGKTLLQVQYVPRDAVAAEDTELVPNEEEEISDESSAENEDSYFVDETETTSRVNTPRPTDDRGYVVRYNVSDNATRPDWVLPPGSVDGVWQMIKEITRWKPEGWLALWKGTATGCVKTFLESSLQPIIHSILTSVFTTVSIAPSPTVFARAHPFLLPVASKLVTGFLLSPLDLIRTRLIVQTSVSKHRRYTGPLDALNHILLHEGGFRGLYLHPNLLYPTLLDCTLTPLVAAAAPHFCARLFSRVLGTSVVEDTHPLLWALAQLGGACVSLLVTLPVETVRRRLQVQPRGMAPVLATCVEVRSRPYAGIVDTLYSILAEERSDLPLRRRKRERRASRVQEKGKGKEGTEEVGVQEESWLKNTGIGQLYRGLGMRAGASVIIFVLSLFAAEPNEGGGWTEL
ncbi:mitochondrial carrier [Phellopilus nigrolimitatus]|nr:mitochondrial carrier [Phellopilus nigrolimitatus]